MSHETIENFRKRVEEATGRDFGTLPVRTDWDGCGAIIASWNGDVLLVFAGAPLFEEADGTEIFDMDQAFLAQMGSTPVPCP